MPAAPVPTSWTMTSPWRGQHGHLSWKKSTASETSACVEVAGAGQAILVRDSKDPSGSTRIFSKTEWEAFLVGSRAGQFPI